MIGVVLAGGLGKRLRPLTDEKPKTMIEVCGLPIIAWQLTWLSNNRIKDVIISLGYLKQSVQNYVGDGKKFDLEVRYSEEKEPLGTGGALKATQSLIGGDDGTEDFIMLYGDILTDLDPWLLIQNMRSNRHNSLGAVASISLRSPFGIIDVNGDRAKAFREKPILSDYLMNAGVYCLSKDIFTVLPERGSFETITLPRLAAEDKLVFTRYGDSVRWRSIDSHKDIEEAESEFGDILPRLL